MLRRIAFAPVVALALASASPASAGEYCTTPPAPSPGDHSCHADLAEGFGGILTFEREPGPKLPLAAHAQWIDEHFLPVGPLVTLDQAASGPMWRPQAVLLDPDTAFAIWSDGRNQQGPLGTPDQYFGFDLKGAILHRGQDKPAATFLLHKGTATAGYIDATISYDALGRRAVVTAWGGGNAKEPFITTYTRDELLAAAREHRDPVSGVELSHVGWGFVALDHDGSLIKLSPDGWNRLRLERMGGLPGGPTRSIGIDLKADLELLPLAAGEDFRWFEHGAVAVGPGGEVAFAVELMTRNERPIGYIFALWSAELKEIRRGYYAGPMPTDINQPRPKVGFQEDEPILFLPIRESATRPAVSLFVAPLGAGPLTLKDGAVFPLPGDLDQFTVVLADGGATGKAALAATSGTAPVRLCVWPSDLIGFKQPAAQVLIKAPASRLPIPGAPAKADAPK